MWYLQPRIRDRPGNQINFGVETSHGGGPECGLGCWLLWSLDCQVGSRSVEVKAVRPGSRCRGGGIPTGDAKLTVPCLVPRLDVQESGIPYQSVMASAQVVNSQRDDWLGKAQTQGDGPARKYRQETAEVLGWMNG